MNKIDKLLQGQKVEWKTLGEVTIWDKRFNGVKKEKQPKVCSFKHISAANLKAMEEKDGNVKLLATGKFDAFTSEKTAGEFLNEG